jgi:predicted ABC-type ATPase
VSHKPVTYALDENRHQRIFRDYILPEYIPDTLVSSPKPTAIILGGQPGSGKTALLIPAEEELNAIGSTVVINGDDLRQYHPQYRPLQAIDPENAAQLTNLDSGKWVEKLIDEGIRCRVNLVIESTMRSHEVFARTSAKLREAGYTVEARAIAVDPRASWQGIHTRYESMIENGSAPRFTLREAHDAGVTGMLHTLSRIEAEKMVDRLLIGTRSGNVIYENRVENGQWTLPPSAAAKVEAERNRLLSPEEYQLHAQGWEDILAKMVVRGADQASIETVKLTAENDKQHYLQINRTGIEHRGLEVEVSSALIGTLPQPSPELTASLLELEAIRAGKPENYREAVANFEKMQPELFKEMAHLTMQLNEKFGEKAFLSSHSKPEERVSPQEQQRLKASVPVFRGAQRACAVAEQKQNINQKVDAPKLDRGRSW